MWYNLVELVFLNENAVAFKLVVHVISSKTLKNYILFVVLWVLFIHLNIPTANSMSQPLKPFAFIYLTCGFPYSLTFPLDSPFVKMTYKNISVAEFLKAFSMSFVIAPIALIGSAIGIYHYSQAMANFTVFFLVKFVLATVEGVWEVDELGLVLWLDVHFTYALIDFLYYSRLSFLIF